MRSVIKSLVKWKVNHPGALGPWARKVILAGSRVTAPFRVLPDFAIIGAQKCGTTSLYNYLSLHPHILPSLKKEVSFLGVNQRHGVGWYRSHFPLAITRALFRRSLGQNPLVGEASTETVFLPGAPAQAAKLLPDLKLILLVRDPITRAISHYYHDFRLGLVSESMEQAFAPAWDNIERDRNEWQDCAARKSRDYQEPRHSYLLRGLYADQVENWLDFYDRSRLLILRAEDFWRDPASTLKQTADFLGLPDWQPESFRQFNEGKYAEPSAEILRRLEEFYAPHEKRFSQLANSR
ncbi:MAG: sulfotransferase domain-containing protein [Pirellulales bacterium]|nr:sulfotransferase domain-containing protein [Pirellulales bacterium]